MNFGISTSIAQDLNREFTGLSVEAEAVTEVYIVVYDGRDSIVEDIVMDVLDEYANSGVIRGYSLDIPYAEGLPYAPTDLGIVLNF